VHITAASYAGVKPVKRVDAKNAAARDEDAVLHYLNQGQPAQRRRRPGNA